MNLKGPEGYQLQQGRHFGQRVKHARTDSEPLEALNYLKGKLFTPVASAKR